jgi:diguanylate cyclase (GGDEF)-like protein
MVEAGGLPALAAVRGVTELEAISRRFNAVVAEFELERILADKVSDTIASRAATASHVAHLHQEAVHESETDGLTALLNRRALDRDLPSECQRIGAGGGDFTYVMIDIDHFKNLNDSLGHQKGDEVLKLVAGTLLTAFRGTDGVYRYGGEEFALILRGAQSESVMATLDKVRQRIEERSKSAGVLVTASFGAAQFPRDAGTAEALISAADGALFQAKARGRNQVVIAG